jgi:hypothetical protein
VQQGGEPRPVGPGEADFLAVQLPLEDRDLMAQDTAPTTRSTPTPTSPRPRIHPPQRRKSMGLPQTTPDNFRDPPPRRIMTSGRVPPHQAIYLARDTIRAAATRSEGGQGGEPADRQKTTSTVPAGPPLTARPPTSGKDHRTDVRVTDVS